MRTRTAALAAIPLAFIVTVAALFATPPAPAAAITRAEVIARAQRWVDLEVPYSQSAYFETYRTDCSGMVSMAWRLPRSYSTRDLTATCVPIMRDELQPGDIMLEYDFHAAIFEQWADADHSWYWTLEQSSDQGHAVRRLTPYPFWGEHDMKPYRYNGIEEVDADGDGILQVAGVDRYGTALAASRHAFATDGADSAVICSGEDWPDALGGSTLAGTLGGPVLLTRRDSLPLGLVEELGRLGVRNVTLVGGTGAISESVEASLAAALPGGTVRRIGGVDRYETAALVASATIEARRDAQLPYDGAVYVATGADFADALGASAVAAHTGRPILLSRPSELPSVTAEAIRSLEASVAYVAGGTAAVSETATAELAEAGASRIERIAGADRYETALALARHGAEEGLAWVPLALATGESFADALAGGVMQARLGSLLVLTPSRMLAPSPDRAIRENADLLEHVVVLGGEGAISETVRRQVTALLGLGPAPGEEPSATATVAPTSTEH